MNSVNHSIQLKKPFGSVVICGPPLCAGAGGDDRDAVPLPGRFKPEKAAWAGFGGCSGCCRGLAARGAHRNREKRLTGSKKPPVA